MELKSDRSGPMESLGVWVAPCADAQTNTGSALNVTCKTSTESNEKLKYL